jgi:hypothetical protein
VSGIESPELATGLLSLGVLLGIPAVWPGAWTYLPRIRIRSPLSLSPVSPIPLPPVGDAPARSQVLSGPDRELVQHLEQLRGRHAQAA